MEKITVKYRSWAKAIPPHPIKLQIPGWAGEANNHTNGDKPQPWHCPPFIEGSTYGLELCYPFDTECHISMIDDKIVFNGDFTEESKQLNFPLPPFTAFAPGHFGMTSSLDIRVPFGHILRTEPHPRFFTDATNTVPCCLIGHLQTDWWPKIFFVVFKNPCAGQTLIFRKGEPYAQILILPKRMNYDIIEMTEQEKIERNYRDSQLDKHANRYVKNNWHDHQGLNFTDKYKQLSTIAAKEGSIDDFLSKFPETELPKQSPSSKKMYKGKLIKRKKDESI
jgi:hypothetical protein